MSLCTSASPLRRLPHPTAAPLQAPRVVVLAALILSLLQLRAAIAKAFLRSRVMQIGRAAARLRRSPHCSNAAVFQRPGMALFRTGPPGVLLIPVGNEQLQSHHRSDLERCSRHGLVAANNCRAARNTLHCLRHAPFDTFMASVNNTSNFLSYRSLNIVWGPRIDGDVVQRDPWVSLSEGLYAKVPVLAGMCDDEGTLFSLSTLNITTDGEFLDYVHFKFSLEKISSTQDAWGWLNKVGKNANGPLGASHASDTPIWFTLAVPEGIDSLLNFINTLDPNRPANDSTSNVSIPWPKWNTPSAAGPSSSLTFWDTGINVTADEFRSEAVGFLNDLRLSEVQLAGG
ncbi:Alpha/Beta hydrolase protein [Mycena albidolilacea]|uniref:Alpha/Beta hydrolase protein n=1 Tax=Mycena albidolilacea TaxID=1033008 RepID=A0AAD7F4L8_9AGAR|nr:Alpha/Beta hydrolase protein [Mycena albidolilacea]